MNENSPQTNVLGDLSAIMGYLHEFQQMLHEAEIEVPIPKIVICGEKNGGKSSIVERFAMTRFFPRRNSISTGMPICLKLHQTPEDQLRKKLSYLKDANRLGNTDKEFSQDISIIQISFSAENEPQSISFALGPKDNPEEIRNYISKCQVHVQDEGRDINKLWEQTLNIDIWRLNTINFQLVDLPGVAVHERQGEQPEMAARSMAITKRYLSEVTTIPVVVVPAGLSSLNYDSVIKMIKELKRTENAVGILSKSDLSYQYGNQDPFAKLVERATGTASDIPEGMQFVAVKNRENVDQHQLSLKYDAEIEVEWFKNHVPGLLEMNLATIDVAMERITEKLRNYLLGWLPTIRRKLENLRIKCENQVRDSEVENPNMKDLCQQLQKLVPKIIGNDPNIYCQNANEIQLVKHRLINNEAALTKIREKLNFDKFVEVFANQYSKLTSQIYKRSFKNRYFESFCHAAKIRILNLLQAMINEIQSKFNVDYEMLMWTWRFKYGARIIQPNELKFMRADIKKLHQYYITVLMHKMKKIRIGNLDIGPSGLTISEEYKEMINDIKKKLLVYERCYLMISRYES